MGEWFLFIDSSLIKKKIADLIITMKNSDVIIDVDVGRPRPKAVKIELF